MQQEIRGERRTKEKTLHSQEKEIKQTNQPIKRTRKEGKRKLTLFTLMWLSFMCM